MRANAQNHFAAVSHAATKTSLTTKVLVGAGLALTIETFLLISLGGMVRNAGAGLSCPDWPLCFGKVVPPMDYLVFLEWFHRLMAGSISVFLLGLSSYVFMKPQFRKLVGWHFAWAIALLATQIILGGLTVLGLLDPVWVSSHLAVALAFFGVVVLATLKLADVGKVAPKPLPRGLSRFAVVTTAVLYGQILLGGLVSSNYAGLACSGFPTCNGQWWPALEGLVTYQVLHRVGALLTTGVLLGFIAVAWKRLSVVSKRGGIALRALPVLLGLQIFFGIGSVFLQLPLPMSVAHLATATCLLGLMLVVSYEIQRGY